MMRNCKYIKVSPIYVYWNSVVEIAVYVRNKALTQPQFGSLELLISTDLFEINCTHWKYICTVYLICIFCIIFSLFLKVTKYE